MTVIGIGCRRGVATADALAAIEAALADRGLARNSLDAIATVPAKRDEPALREASRLLGLPLLVPGDEAIAASAAKTWTRSDASLAAAGVPSVCETAALAAAGPRARLLGARSVHGSVTCAIAVSEMPT